MATKNKHNKKKNTILVFECVAKEIAKLSMEKKQAEFDKVSQYIKEFFFKGSLLSKELMIYKEVLSTENQPKEICQRILEEAVSQYNSLPLEELDLERMRFVKKVSSVRPNFLDNFVEDFRNYGTVFQYLNQSSSGKIKDRILLENTIIEKMTSPVKKEEQKLIPKDDLVMRSFVKRFNETYGNLLPSQKELINKYTFSVGNKTLEYKIFLNEEIGRLKVKLTESKGKFNDEVNAKIEQLITLCEGYSKQADLEEKEIIRLLEIQELVELLNDQ